MTKNAKLFKDYLTSIGLDIDFMDLDDGSTLLKNQEILEGGINIRYCIHFTEGESLIGMMATDFVGPIDPSKRNKILDLINDLNNKNLLFKLVLGSYTIEIQTFLIVNSSFDPSTILDHVLDMFDFVQKEYSNIMKCIWS